MTPLVTSAVLLAAVTHAGWNAIAHKITDKLVGFTLIAGGGVLIGLALMPFGTFPAARAWPYLLTSAFIHIVYFALLMKSFRLGDFGQAYPIARGTAPLVVAVFAAVFAHEVPNGWGPPGSPCPARGSPASPCGGCAGAGRTGRRSARPWRPG